MYSLVCLIRLDGADDVSPALAELGAAVAPVLEGSFNGGDVAAHFTVADEAEHAARRAQIHAVLDRAAHADTALFRHGEQVTGAPDLASGIHRTLLLCADRDASAERLERFAVEMVRMPEYIPAIRNWRFSRVLEATGGRRWTHVWEQEFDDLDGLFGPYMMHPYHWAVIDRWFDPECTEWMIDPLLCHSFSAYGRNIIGAPHVARS
jgi:hypothetical protein